MVHSWFMLIYLKIKRWLSSSQIVSLPEGIILSVISYDISTGYPQYDHSCWLNLDSFTQWHPGHTLTQFQAHEIPNLCFVLHSIYLWIICTFRPWNLFFCFWTLTGFSSPYLAWWNHIKSLFLRVESGWIPIFPWLNPCRLWKIAIASSDSGTKPTDHSHISCYLHCHSIVPSGIFAPGFH